MNIIITNITSSFDTDILPEHWTELDAQMSFGVDNSFWIKKQMKAKYASRGVSNNSWIDNWDGRTHLLTKGNKFPTGYLPDVCKFLTDKNYAFNIIDKRVKPALDPARPIYFTPWDHQKEAMASLLQNSRGVAQIGTGGGKSKIMALTCALLNCPTVVLTQKVDLLYQLKKSFEEALHIPIGIFGDGQWEYQPITDRKSVV